LAWRAGSIFLLLSGGQETGHKHDENSDQPHHLGGNAGDHELRTSNNIVSADVNNEQKMRYLLISQFLTYELAAGIQQVLGTRQPLERRINRRDGTAHCIVRACLNQSLRDSLLRRS
jgi:hypothetical protein